MLEDDGLAAPGRRRLARGRRPLAGSRCPPRSRPSSPPGSIASSPDEQAVLGTAAVIGKEFWWGAVAELSPEDARAGVGGHLQTLVRKGLIAPERSTLAGEDAFRFHHILIQDASYQAIPKERRAELHERFAGWIEGHAGDRTLEYEEVVGYHLEQAHRYRTELGMTGAETDRVGARAAERLSRAGRRALARGRHGRRRLAPRAGLRAARRERSCAGRAPARPQRGADGGRRARPRRRRAHRGDQERRDRG